MRAPRTAPSPPAHPPAFASIRDFYRALALVGVVGITLFYWIHRAASPGAVDPVWQRVLLASACAALLVATWRATPRTITRFANVVFYGITIWIVQLVVRNDFAEEYALALVVVAAGIAGTYRDRRQLAFYQATTLAGIGVAAWLVDEPRIDLLVYGSYAVVMTILAYVAVAARLDLDVRRADSEERYAEATERLAWDSTHDRLTGLPNRALLVDRLDRLIAVSRRRPDSLFAVLVIDLDRFRRVNDSLGHAVGDALLLEVAERLGGALREEDTLARIGADEFVVLVPQVDDMEDLLRLGDRLRASLEGPVTVADEPIHLSAGIGMAVGPADHGDPEELIRHAYLAMHRSKRDQLDRPQLFDETMHRHAVEQLRLEADLRRAMDEGELELHYQPILRLGTGRVEGLEALVRWRHPERGLLHPDAFLPLAEETGLIVELGRWALGEACRAQRRWAAAVGADGNDGEGPAPSVHVNLSAAHFRAGSVLEDVVEALGDGDAGVLGIEVTESVLLSDHHAAADVLGELRRRGVGISIDDFGTGYSSLRYLHSLPADVLKIDRSFVERCRESRGADLLRTIVVLAERVGLSTVAEGVETEDQADVIRTVGATHVQGFLYARALPEPDTLREMRGWLGGGRGGGGRGGPGRA